MARFTYGSVSKGYRKKPSKKYRRTQVYNQKKSRFTVQKARTGAIQATKVTGAKGGELRASITHTNENKQYIVGGDGIQVELNTPEKGQIRISFDSSTSVLE